MISQRPPELSSKQKQAQGIQPSSQAPTGLRWWRRTLFGYILALLIVAASVGITLLGELLLPGFHFPSAVLLVAILCVALIWGVGPGLFAMFLSCAALFYFYIAPLGLHLLPKNWELLFQVLPFALAGLVVAVITAQRETARRQALRAEQIAQTHVDELARINEELLRANQLKDLFASITSHELKTPITTISGHAQLAIRRIDRDPESTSDSEDLRIAFVKIDQQTKRITRLLDELLDLSSLRSGKVMLEKGPCDLNEICSQVVEEQRLLSERTIELVVPPSPIQLQANAMRLSQVVTNLVSNALKYSPLETIVSVKVRSDEHHAYLSVEDQGSGISPEQLANIFQPFYRTTNARASKVSGTGLGLAICKEIVEQHQGRIWCESTPGHGSTFFVELPLSTSADLSASAIH